MTTAQPTAQQPNPARPGLKQRAVEEFKDYAGVSAYLAVLFCAIAAYTLLIARQYDEDIPLTFTFALFNAVVLGKVILIGKMMHLGRRYEARPLYQTVLVKSVLFGLLIFAFHLFEEFVKRLIHHEPAGTALEQFSLEQLAARSIIILLALIPLFAFRELDRILGGSRLRTLFTKSPTQLQNPT